MVTVGLITAHTGAPQDCNLVAYDASGSPIYYSATYGQGTAPCRMVVSGSGIAVLDASNAVLFSQGANSPAGTPAGTLPANAVLMQVRLLLRGTLGDAVIKAGT